MRKGFKYRFYPTPDQEVILRKTIGCCRFIYNKALATKTQAWGDSKSRMTAYDLHKMITLWKKEEDTLWLQEVPNVTLQQSINNLEVAFQNFFAKRSRYPKFKKKGSGGTCRFTTSGFRIHNGKVSVARTPGNLDIRWSRPLPEGFPPSQCTIILSPSGEWHISFLCDVIITKFPDLDKHIGIDMGITSLITTSEGEKFSNPFTGRKYRSKLANRQRHLARKQKGSNNRHKAKLKVARIHRKISDIRKDQLHKLTTRLVRENQSIAIEDLAVRNMMKNHRLAGSISDSGWQMLRSMLEYKCRWYGREFRIIDRFFPSSKTCHACGNVADNMPLNIREWKCRCGIVHDRDINAAKNILAAGIVVNACGGAVRPKRRKTMTQASMKQENCEKS